MKPAIVFLLSLLVISCNSAAPVANSNRPINAAQQSNEAKSVLAHTTEGQSQRPANASPARPSQMGEPIDTSKLDAAIAAAEKVSKEKPSDASKKALAEAYFERGVALTDAKQYASALGDYRRALKLDPAHEESKKWIDEITKIYGSLKRDAPKEGQEPPPLPFKKDA